MKGNFKENSQSNIFTGTCYRCVKLGHEEADCWIRQAYEKWNKGGNQQQMNQETREKGQQDIRYFLKRKREEGQDVTHIQDLVTSLPEDFVFAIRSGQIQPEEDLTWVTSVEGEEWSEGPWEQSYFWQDSLYDVPNYQCSPFCPTPYTIDGRPLISPTNPN